MPRFARYVLWLVMICSSPVSSSRADTAYLAELSASDVFRPSSSSATGYWAGTFADFGEHPDQCPGQDDRLRFGWASDNLECEPVSVALWIREVGADPKLYERLPVDATVVEVSVESCDDLRNSMWIVIETECYPDGEIGGQVREEITLPVADSTWTKVKSTYQKR